MTDLDMLDALSRDWDVTLTAAFLTLTDFAGNQYSYRRSDYPTLHACILSAYHGEPGHSGRTP